MDITRKNLFFFFNDTATTEIYTLSLHDALPIYRRGSSPHRRVHFLGPVSTHAPPRHYRSRCQRAQKMNTDRKSTRLNSSHLGISYAVFCLKKKKTTK